MTPSVVVYVARGCHLCEAALEVVGRAREEYVFPFEVVDITGDPELERRYRTLIPVVAIDSERAFTYHVQPDALREHLIRAG